MKECYTGAGTHKLVYAWKSMVIKSAALSAQLHYANNYSIAVMSQAHQITACARALTAGFFG